MRKIQRTKVKRASCLRRRAAQARKHNASNATSVDEVSCGTLSVSTASRPDSPKYSRAGAGVLTLRRPATNAPTIKTAATTQIVAMMLPEAVVVIVSELPDDDDEAAGMISVRRRGRRAGRRDHNGCGRGRGRRR